MNKKLQLAFILICMLVSGSVTALDIQKINSYSNNDQLLLELKNGSLELNCDTLTCFQEAGTYTPSIWLSIKQKDYRNALAIIKVIDSDSGLSYMPLGQIATEYGFFDAAKKYYQMAIDSLKLRGEAASCDTECRKDTQKVSGMVLSALNHTRKLEEQTLKQAQEGGEAQEEKENLAWAKSVINKPVSDFNKIFPKALDHKKGKYETTEEYEKRLLIKNSDQLIFDIGQKHDLSAYNADTEEMKAVFPIEGSLYLYTAGDDSKFKDLEHGIIVWDGALDNGSYAAQNAYGAQYEVFKKDFFSNEVYSSNFAGFFKASSLGISSAGIYDVVAFNHSIPRKDIESVDKNIKLRLIYEEPKSLLDYYSETVMRDPERVLERWLETTHTSRYIRAEIIGAVVYNKQTKEVYYSLRKP